MFTQITPGKWKINIEEDKPKPKTLFDRFWGGLGKFIKAISPVVVLIIVFFIGVSVNNNSFQFFDFLDSFLQENGLQIFSVQTDDSREDYPSPSPPNTDSNASKNLYVLVSEGATEDDAYQLQENLKTMRLISAVQAQSDGSYAVIIQNLVSASRAQHIVDELKSRGYSGARMVKQ